LMNRLVILRERERELGFDFLASSTSQPHVLYVMQVDTSVRSAWIRQDHFVAGLGRKA